MRRRIVVLGAGTGGTLAANKLRRIYREEQVGITIVDQDDDHIYQPGLLFVPFGLRKASDLVRSRRLQLRNGIDYMQARVDRVDIAGNCAVLETGESLTYDVLVIATGASLLPEETQGLLGPGWNNSVFTFYTAQGASALADALSKFDAGRIVVDIVDLPIKCPVAPLEFCFLADTYFTKRGIRDQVELIFATPLDGAFSRPTCSRVLERVLTEKRIEVVPEFNLGEVDNENKDLVGFDGRKVAFDLAVVIPLHGGAEYVARSRDLGDQLNFIPTNEKTLQSRVSPNIFVIGDATDIPASKAGSVAHFEGDILVENVRRFLARETLDANFDGHANCFIESGHGKAILIDFNYETEPLPGRFPGRIGLPLLKQSRLNHIGKLMFELFYWHVLLPGRRVPGIPDAMPIQGKQLSLKETGPTKGGLIWSRKQ